VGLCCRGIWAVVWFGSAGVRVLGVNDLPLDFWVGGSVLR
jgi:hypothetical protein